MLSGTFAAAFAREGLAFDVATGTFQLHETHGPAVRLMGEGAAAFWTRRAYTLTTSADAACQVAITGSPIAWQWTSQLGGQQQTYRTVQALLAGLPAQQQALPKEG